MPGSVMNETNLSQCPSPAELRAFAVGDLGEGDIDRIADHVVGCEPCDRALRSLDGMTDGLLRFPTANFVAPAMCPTPGRTPGRRILRPPPVITRRSSQRQKSATNVRTLIG